MAVGTASLRWVESGDVRLAVHESGRPDGPPVVCMHGLTGTHEYVLLRSRILQRAGHRVVSYDARGHGLSSAAPDYSYAALLRDLEAVMDDLALERVAFVGASMGAHVGLSYAMRHPERVAAIVAVTPAYSPHYSFLPEVLARWDALAEALRGGGPARFAEVYAEEAHLSEPWLSRVLALLRRRMLLHASCDAVADAIQAVPRSRPYEQIADVAAVPHPVLVAATRDVLDPEHPLAIAHEYADALPGARVEVEPEGRFPLSWSGGRLSRLIEEFFAGVESWAPALEAPAA
jgi:pimeloyl-ACP methyl ester carboxylesterase